MMNKNVQWFKQLIKIAADFDRMKNALFTDPYYYGYGPGSENMYDDDYDKALADVVAEIRKDPSLVNSVSYEHNTYEACIVERALEEVGKK